MIFRGTPINSDILFLSARHLDCFNASKVIEVVKFLLPPETELGSFDRNVLLLQKRNPVACSVPAAHKGPTSFG